MYSPDDCGPNRGMKRHLSALMIFVAALLALMPAASAQQNPIVGVWSYSAYRSDGQQSHAFFFQFSPDGRFRQQMVIPGLTQNYVGAYQLSPDLGTLSLVYYDYDPKQDCRYGACYPIRPIVAMNSPINAQIRFLSAARFEMMDASGPMLWVRAQ